MENNIFKVKINQITRVIYISKGNELHKYRYTEWDEWHSFKMNNQLYDCHYYDEENQEIDFNIYPVYGEEGNYNTDYNDSQKKEIEIIYRKSKKIELNLM